MDEDRAGRKITTIHSKKKKKIDRATKLKTQKEAKNLIKLLSKWEGQKIERTYKIKSFKSHFKLSGNKKGLFFSWYKKVKLNFRNYNKCKGK